MKNIKGKKKILNEEENLKEDSSGSSSVRLRGQPISLPLTNPNQASHSNPSKTPRISSSSKRAEELREEEELRKRSMSSESSHSSTYSNHENINE
ncbi:uncharacterized protein MELLADRAFT_73592 [Melampsora larici-populina 98AG31]|uniref:Uncharacterized protein n=1 Tax=Melampsora larici-populina (strain 98AG31 / pathotype 3-4-7) TaxID=747676 RepID=F4SA35_MELLP|nr:uncharacterized protein MELLADRAFT_73592 [Melampsora larici-populina 98AG31]EGF98480.1 hypothetical protein MELLADRAFT_73592 [Melampsora larici-populina 98AG31]